MGEIKTDTYFDEPEGIDSVVPIGQYFVVAYNDGVIDVLVETYDPVEDISSGEVMHSVNYGESKIRASSPEYAVLMWDAYQTAVKWTIAQYRDAAELRNYLKFDDDPI